MKTTSYIVDDSQAGRERLLSVIETFLKDKLEVIGVSERALDALHQIPKLNPDIAFLDVEMPGMTGLELAEKLHAKGYLGKIVFITGHIQYSVKAIRARAFDYLVKPIDVDELKQCIERYKSVANNGFNKNIIAEYELSAREMELIEHLSTGLSSSETAAKMTLSRHTIDTHRRNIHTKTGTRNVVELLNLLRS